MCRITFLLTIVTLLTSPLFATSQWDGETDSNWSDATNWDPNVVPATVDPNEYCEIYGFWYMPNWPTVFGNVDSPHIILGLGDVETPVLTVDSAATLNVTSIIDTGWYHGSDQMVINGDVNCYDPNTDPNATAKFRLGESRNPDAVDPNRPTFDERAYSEVIVNAGGELNIEWLRFGFYNYWDGNTVPGQGNDYRDFNETNRGAYGEIIVDGGTVNIEQYGPWNNWLNYTYGSNHDGTGIHIKSDDANGMVTFHFDNTRCFLYWKREIIVDDGWGKAVFTNDEEVSPGVWRDVYRGEPYIPGTDIEHVQDAWFQWDNRGYTRSVHDYYNYGLKNENTPGAGPGTVAADNENKLPWPGDELWLLGNTNLGEHPICDVNFYLGKLIIGEHMNYNLHPARTVNEGFEVVFGGSLTVVDIDPTDDTDADQPGQAMIIIGKSRLSGVEDTGKGTLIMNGGTLLCGDLINGQGGYQVGYDFPDDYYYGEGTIQMNAGTIDCNMLSMAILADPPTDNNVVGSGTINLLGGTINIIEGSNLIGIADSNGIYVTAGTMIIEGDMAAELTALVGTKITTAAGRTVDIDYNTTNPGKTTLTSSCPNGVDVGDLDFDCDVDIDDVAIMTGDWLQSSCIGDISGNCYVDLEDFASLADNYNPTP